MHLELSRLHTEFSKRDNASKSVLINTYLGSRRVNNAIAAAILSFGDVHGPIAPTMKYLREGGYDLAMDHINQERKIPGWGCDFNESEDQYSKLRSYIPGIMIDRINSITQSLKVNPNIACYTAAYAILNKVPEDLADSLIIRFRLSAWIEILQETFQIKWE